MNERGRGLRQRAHPLLDKYIGTLRSSIITRQQATSSRVRTERLSLWQFGTRVGYGYVCFVPISVFWVKWRPWSISVTWKGCWIATSAPTSPSSEPRTKPTPNPPADAVTTANPRDHAVKEGRGWVTTLRFREGRVRRLPGRRRKIPGGSGSACRVSTRAGRRGGQQVVDGGNRLKGVKDPLSSWLSVAGI